MHSVEIFKLRKSGETQKAYEEAEKALAENPEDLWLKRAMGWTLYDLLKQNTSPENYELFIKYFNEFAALNIADNNQDSIFYEALIYPLSSFLSNLKKKGNINFSILNTLLEAFQKLNYKKPGILHSTIAERIMSFAEEWKKFDAFIDWWGLDNLRKEDYEKRTNTLNGKSYLSLAEQMYIHVAKNILKGKLKPVDASTGTQFAKLIDNKRIEAFLPKLKKLIKEHPEFVYPPYYYGKLLLEQGEKEEALKAFLPFARKKSKDFWVWDLLADFHKKDKTLYLTCLSKALMTSSPEKMLVKVRTKFAKVLLSLNKRECAKTEIEKLFHTYTSERWEVPSIISNWMKESWYVETKANNSNVVFYKEHAHKAIGLLYKDMPSKTGMVYSVNRAKKIMYFIVNEDILGHFKYIGSGLQPKEGDFYELVLEKRMSKKGQYLHTLAAFPTNKEIPDFKKEVIGNLQLPEHLPIGFLDDAIVSPELVRKYKNKNLPNNNLHGRAIKTYNNKKQTFGWKVIEFMES